MMSKTLRAHSVPGFWLRCLTGLTNNNLQARLKHANAGIAVAELVVVSILSERPSISINELAHLAGMHQAPISRIVEKLSKKGLVLRVTSLEDRRSVNVKLTKSGEALRERLKGITNVNAAESFACLSEEEYEVFMSTIKKVLRSHNFDTTGY
ncbi:MAG: MarR family winged helix-turn-helix transcriptional regulator [Leucothrix sp.]